MAQLSDAQLVISSMVLAALWGPALELDWAVLVAYLLMPGMAGNGSKGNNPLVRIEESAIDSQQARVDPRGLARYLFGLCPRVCPKSGAIGNFRMGQHEVLIVGC